MVKAPSELSRFATMGSDLMAVKRFCGRGVEQAAPLAQDGLVLTPP